MNFADALRKAREQAGHAGAQESFEPVYPESVEVPVAQPETPAAPQRDRKPTRAARRHKDPEPGEHESSSVGTAVRLEMFLTPEQLSSLFRAVVATQHSVMTLREAANHLRVGHHTLEEMAREGEVPAFLVEGKWRFPRAGLDEWMSTQAIRKEAS